MAIFSRALLTSGLLASLALAAPLNHRARDMITDIVTETVWTTLDVTTTIYDDEPPATSAAVMPTSTAVAMTSAWSAAPIVPSSSSSAAAVVASYAPGPSSSAPEFFTTMASGPTSSSMAPQVATPTVVASSPPPAMSSSAAPPPSPSSSSSSPSTGSVPAGSMTGTCEGESEPCVGDVTHWDGGLGACGTVVDTDSDLAIALPYEFMGTLSNTNPYCGRSVTLYNPTSGTTVQATVRDKCMGCVDRAIDCTDILFNQITDNLGNGRMSGIEWWLN